MSESPFVEYGVPVVTIGLLGTAFALHLAGIESVAGLAVIDSGDYSLGLLAAGNFSVGVFAVGTFAVGVFAAGIFSLGLFSIGIFSLGLLAVGLYNTGVIGKLDSNDGQWRF